MNSNRLWIFAWTVLWIGGCADSDVRESEPASESEPAGRSEVVILTPTDSVSTPIRTSDASDASDASNTSDARDASNTDDTSDARPVFFNPDGQFAVQIGVYGDAKRADQKVRELKDEGYPAYSVQSDAGVRVRIGYFANHADADRFGRIFAKDRGGDYWIARRADE